jgi:signal peptidase II
MTVCPYNRRAMSTTKRLLLILTILFSCVGCDQATKSVAKAYLSETHSVVLLGDTVRLQLAKNYGAFLSLGSSVGEASRGVLFSVVVGAVLSALLAYLFISKPENPIVGVSVALIVGGGVSNLIDRLRYGGYVVDFLNVGIGPVRTGIFNVADMAIMVGVVLWAFSDRFWKKESG